MVLFLASFVVLVSFLESRGRGMTLPQVIPKVGWMRELVTTHVTTHVATHVTMLGMNKGKGMVTLHVMMLVMNNVRMMVTKMGKQ